MEIFSFISFTSLGLRHQLSDLESREFPLRTLGKRGKGCLVGADDVQENKEKDSGSPIRDCSAKLEDDASCSKLTRCQQNSLKDEDKRVLMICFKH